MGAWLYDYDEKVTINDTEHNKKFVFIGDNSGKAKNIYIAPRHWVDVDPTKDSFTQDEFIQVINDGNQALMKVGALITLNNTYCDTYEVIGVNHDSTTGTVDIMSHTQVQTLKFSDSSQYYEGSTNAVRPWINDTYLSAFDNSMQNLAKAIYKNDKVKLLSCAEVNYSNSSAPVEGTVYEAFINATTTKSLRWRGAGSYGNSSYYWLRTRSTISTYGVWYIYSDGSCSNTNCFNTYGVLPVLRF